MLLPARYPGSGASGDGALQLSRRTEWREIGPDQYAGLGQRVLTTDAAELGLLEVRQIAWQGGDAGVDPVVDSPADPAVGAPADPAVGAPADPAAGAPADPAAGRAVH